MNVTLIKSILLANSNDASLIYLPCFKLNYFFLLILSPNNCNEKQITDCRWAKNAACCTLSSVDLCTALNKRLWLLGLDKEERAWVVTRRWPWQTQTLLISLCTLLPEPALAHISPSITVLMLVHPQSLIHQDPHISSMGLNMLLASHSLVFIIPAIYHQQPSTVQMPSVLVWITQGLNKRMFDIYTVWVTHHLDSWIHSGLVKQDKVCPYG